MADPAMDGLVAFLKARLDEDEQMARAATAGPWTVDDKSYAETIWGDSDMTAVVAGGRWGGEGNVFDSTEDALHIVRHDPARVLREVEAKRRIVERYRAMIEDFVHVNETVHEFAQREVLEDVLELLALPYADHEDYRSEWAV